MERGELERGGFNLKQHPESMLKPWERSQQKLTELYIADEHFHNKQGCFRWKFIRSAYFSNFIDTDKVVDLYQKWRDQQEYLWLDGFDIQGEYVKSLFVKCSKRGNDVYKSRLKTKFSFLNNLDPIYFFGEWGRKCTPMIFVTLTVDSKKYDIDQAWDQISMELHLFESKLRQKYGSFVKFRVWESHESGFPHAHIVYYFHDKWFQAFKHKDKYRITTKHKDTISNYWSMGNVDVQAVQDTHGAFSEVQKYITKNIWSKKGDLTNAMICLHRKQMYWISQADPYVKLHEAMDAYREMYENKLTIKQVLHLELQLLQTLMQEFLHKDFIGSIWGKQIYDSFYKDGCVDLAEPNTTALVKDSVHYCNIAYPEIVKFRFVGCVLHADLLQFMPDLSDSWVIIADPPPDLEGYLSILNRVYSLDEV